MARDYGGDCREGVEGEGDMGKRQLGRAAVCRRVVRVRRRSVHTREWAGRVDARYIAQWW